MTLTVHVRNCSHTITAGNFTFAFVSCTKGYWQAFYFYAIKLISDKNHPSSSELILKKSHFIDLTLCYFSLLFSQ